jgi:hypothetical protein
MTSDEKAATFGRLSNQMGDRFPILLPQIAGKEPVTAMAANLATTNPNLAADIFRGQDLLKTGTVKTDSADKYAASFDAKVGGALRHAGTRAGDLRDSAMALLAARRMAGGKVEAPDVSYGDDQTEFDAAIDEISGGIFDYKGESIVAPEAGMTSDDFANIMSYVDGEDLAVVTDTGHTMAPIMGTGAPLTAEAFKKYGKLEPVNTGGRYLVNLGTTEAPQYALDPITHQPYVFDWQGNAAGARRRAAEASQMRREGILAPLLGGSNDALGGGSGVDRLASVDVRIQGQDVKVNPSVAMFLQRLLGITVGAPSANPPLPPGASEALGIPDKRSQPAPGS